MAVYELCGKIEDFAPSFAEGFLKKGRKFLVADIVFDEEVCVYIEDIVSSHADLSAAHSALKRLLREERRCVGRGGWLVGRGFDADHADRGIVIPIPKRGIIAVWLP